MHLNSNIFSLQYWFPHRKQTCLVILTRVINFGFCLPGKKRKAFKTSSNLDPPMWCERHGSILDFTSQTASVCNAKFLWKQECKAVCDVKSRIDPWLSHHGRGSKLLLVLPSLCGLHSTEKAKFWVTMVTYWLLWIGRLTLGKKKRFEFRSTLNMRLYVRTAHHANTYSS